MITILWLGIFQCFFFIALLEGKKPKRTGSRFLSLWLMIFAIHIGSVIPLVSGSLNPLIGSFAKTMMLLHGPMLFLYARVVLSGRQLKEQDFLHLLLFVIPLVFFLLAGEQSNPTADLVLAILKTLSIPFYVWHTHRAVNKRLAWIKDQTADATYLRIKWIKTIALLFMSTILLELAYVLFDIFLPGTFTQVVDSLIYDLLIVLIGYFGIRQGIIYEHTAAEMPPVASYSTSPLQDDLSETAKRVTDYLHKEKPFKEPDFDLNKLAAQLDMPRHHLSEVLNKGLGKSFYELINTLRIKEAVSLIRTGKLEELSVEGLGYEVGFNSKSAFFTHFKKITATTPLQYQKELKSGSD